MQRVVNCKLVINRFISEKEETSVIEAKGYYKKDDNEVVVFFSSEDVKYKYMYKDGVLNVFCNDSKYTFKENEKGIGEIKNGDFIFKITTFSTKIELTDNSIVLDYSLYQEDLIGNYYSVLSFN